MNKVKYKVSTGEVLAVSASPELVAGDDELVIDWSGDIVLTDDIIIENGTVRKRTLSEKQAVKDLKDAEKESKKNAKNNVLQKLGITQEELNSLLERE